MSYPINSTTGQLLIQILDGTADGPNINPGANTTDVNLFGKNYSLYGELLNENFIKLMQNFANDNAPTRPLIGELWYDTANSLLKVYNGVAFIPASPVIISGSQPAITVVGSQWWDTVNHQLYMYSATGWTLVGPSYKYPDGTSGPVVDTVIDIYGTTHTITKFYSQNRVTAILSYDATFTINPTYPVTGFSILAPGITLATGVVNEYQFVGSATNAKSLGNIAAANYARTDITPTFNANINIGGGAIAIDSAPTGAARYYNTVNGGNISLWPTIGGVSNRAFSIWGADGSTNVLNNLNVNGTVTTIGQNLVVLGTTTVHGVTSGGATGVGRFVFDASPTLIGTPLAPTAAQGTVTTQIATTEFVNTAIATSTTAPWQGSHKFVANVAPTSGYGSVGDFWFQI
jgi:hypothetical protein